MSTPTSTGVTSRIRTWNMKPPADQTRSRDDARGSGTSNGYRYDGAPSADRLVWPRSGQRRGRWSPALLAHRPWPELLTSDVCRVNTGREPWIAVNGNHQRRLPAAVTHIDTLIKPRPADARRAFRSKPDAKRPSHRWIIRKLT